MVSMLLSTSWRFHSQLCLQFLLQSALFRSSNTQFENIIAHNQLQLSHVLLNLASRPALVEELRAELAEVDAQDDGPWSKQRVQLLRKMDSVLKESQRLYPVSLGAYPHH